MSCDSYSQAILEDAAVEGLDAHLATCAACRELHQSHRAARGLRGAVPVVSASPRARVLRRAGALALVLAAAGVVLASRSGPVVIGAVADGGPGVEGHFTVLPRGDQAEAGEAEWNALIALRSAVALETHRDLRVVDVTYTPFGALPAWVAQPSLQPMRSLGPAVSPLVYTPED